jgi:hypothetical protein
MQGAARPVLKEYRQELEASARLKYYVAGQWWPR